MKNLKEFVNGQDNNLDYIDEMLLPHIAIDMKNHNVWTKAHIVLEKYGVYEGLREVVDYIYKDIKREFRNKDIPPKFTMTVKSSAFKGIPNVFFNKLIINVDTKSDEGGAYINNRTELNDDMLVDEVHIYVWETDIDKIIDTLYHELTHAYNHWKLLIKSEDGIADLVDKDFYSSLMPDDYHKDAIREFVQNVLYITLDSERNAFIAQLEGEIKRSMIYKTKKIKSPLDALEIIKNTQIYKNYKYYINQIMAYKAGKVPVYVSEMVAYEYNKLAKTKLTPNKVFKKLEALLNKSLKKIETQIGKICLNLFEIPNSTIPSNTWLNKAKKPLVVILMMLVSMVGFAQNIFITDDIETLKHETGVTEEYMLGGEGAVFYKETSKDDWSRLTDRNILLIINDTLGYFQVILDNGDDSTYIVSEYYYKYISWEPELPMCLVSKDWLGFENAALCIDNDGETCYIYVIIHDRRARDWFMYIIECDSTLPF